MIKSSSNSTGDLITTKLPDIADLNYAPRSGWDEMSDADHFVQFYEADGFLLNSLSGFIGQAITSGDAAIVVATPEHRDGLDELLQANGLDVTSAKRGGRYVSLDAADTLSKFMLDGAPEPARFNEVMGSVITGVSDGRSRIKAFGEMVALLWAEGNEPGVLELEELWNELQSEVSFATSSPGAHTPKTPHSSPIGRSSSSMCS